VDLERIEKAVAVINGKKNPIGRYRFSILENKRVTSAIPQTQS
jgi:hypothetical protein